ncbi:hypothetical protein DERF_002856 [Dermatophagoides farinae]|uniref:Uncharacterized protein n=1 Tax=Dermatophagoides farinae TaxID=6954 RepID=A0A922IDZ4_DERFA|nr:hypothetical protein DERF_002856 [Dermatophagoides farinae]
MSCQKELTNNKVLSGKCWYYHHLHHCLDDDDDDSGARQKKYRLLRFCKKFYKADQNISSSSSTTFIFKYHHHLHDHYQKRHLSIIMTILMIACFAYLSISEVAFCLPENMKDSNLNNNRILPNYNDKNDQSVTISRRNIPYDDQNNHHHHHHHYMSHRDVIVNHKIMNRRLKRDLFIFPESENVVYNHNDNGENSSLDRQTRENHRMNQTTNRSYESCPSKECFRKVANFERYLRLYAPKSQQMTQFECVLRDIFFNCIKDTAHKQPKKCVKKRYDQIKKRIAKLLSETRLCIGGRRHTIPTLFNGFSSK